MSKFSVHVFRKARRGACVIVEADDESHAAALAYVATHPDSVKVPVVRTDGVCYWVEGVQMWVTQSKEQA